MATQLLTLHLGQLHKWTLIAALEDVVDAGSRARGMGVLRLAVAYLFFLSQISEFSDGR